MVYLDDDFDDEIIYISPKKNDEDYVEYNATVDTDTKNNIFVKRKYFKGKKNSFKNKIINNLFLKIKDIANTYPIIIGDTDDETVSFNNKVYMENK